MINIGISILGGGGGVKLFFNFMLSNTNDVKFCFQ